YDRLYSSLISILKEYGLSGLILSTMTPESTETLPFIVHTPGMKRRLGDWAALPEEAASLEEMILQVNGPNFPITAQRFELIRWARQTLEEIERLWLMNPDIHPETLPENPLYVWGAAAMDGFFTDEELPRAVAFIEEKFGRLTEHPRMTTFLAQAIAVAHL